VAHLRYLCINSRFLLGTRKIHSGPNNRPFSRTFRETVNRQGLVPRPGAIRLYLCKLFTFWLLTTLAIAIPLRVWIRVPPTRSPSTTTQPPSADSAGRSKEKKRKTRNTIASMLVQQYITNINYQLIKVTTSPDLFQGCNGGKIRLDFTQTNVDRFLQVYAKSTL
jgi:hypothetical protein